MTPEWLEFAKLFFAFASTVILAIISWLTVRQAKKVEEVKTVLQDSTTKTDTKLNETAVKLEEIHVLANGAMTASMRLVAKFARRLADATQKPDDLKAAQEAEDTLAEHEKLNVKARA
jgi:RNA polymerase-interacting CarD/CdnL/TRCF family regulator